MLSYGVLGAIIAKERYGYGQKVDVSHLGSMMWTRGMQNGISMLQGQEFQRQGSREAGNVLWNYYECSDGEWIAFSMGQSDRYWPTFCKGLNRLELLEDDRYNSMDARYENRAELIALLDGIFKTRTRDEWEKRMLEAGDLIFERVQHTLDLSLIHISEPTRPY